MSFNIMCPAYDCNVAQTILIEQLDIVLLDLMLPVTARLTMFRQTHTLYKGKVLMLTTGDDDFDRIAGKKGLMTLPSSQ
ncbi:MULTISPECIES: hypothetical protein [Vibrio]|uniref:hypothetical protein n=1 Tax=Vibrio sp. ED004 TaxID=2785124 RepID=UPI0020C02906|nr:MULTISPECIES: hypothetical protein [Vibrio]